MMISKFNRLIRNKFLWAFFAVFVSLAMVGLFSPTGGGADARDRSPGKLFGEPVSAEEFQRARLFTLGFQGHAADTPEARMALEEEIWKRLAMLRKAGQLNITVSDEELAQTIQSNPAFQENGRFSVRLYDQLVRGRMRIDRPLFEAYLREEMILQRVGAVMSQTLWIAPEEVERTVRGFTDVFSIATVRLPYHSITGKVEVTEADARAYYEAHPRRFREPETRTVRYVRWNAGAFEDGLVVDPADIEAYYEVNLEDFIVALDEHAEGEVSDHPIYQPLESVSNTIHEVLLRQSAMFEAERVAMDFVEALAPGRYGSGPPFDEVAATWGLAVSTTAYFSAWAAIPGITAGRDFNRSAFRLDPADPAGYFSYPVRGTNGVYVMAVDAIREAYTSEWEAARERAAELARIEAEEQAFDDYLAATRRMLADACESGMTIEEAAGPLDLTVSVKPSFSIYNEEQDFLPDFNRIVGVIMDLRTGEISEPVRTVDGAILVYVADRSPGDEFATEMLRPEVVEMLHGHRARTHLEAWGRDLVARARTLPGDREPGP